LKCFTRARVIYDIHEDISKEILKQIRKKRPLIHVISNVVTIESLADIILATGGIPIAAYSPEEVEEVVKWCEEVKKKRQAINIIERNPFKDKFDWMRRIIAIEIDTSLLTAKPHNLFYDSTTKKLYMFINGQWLPINKTKMW